MNIPGTTFEVVVKYRVFELVYDVFDVVKYITLLLEDSTAIVGKSVSVYWIPPNVYKSLGLLIYWTSSILPVAFTLLTLA